MDGCCLMRSFELGRYRGITGSRYRNLWMCPKFVGQGWVKMRCRRPNTEEARGWFFFFVCKIWNLTNAREIVARRERLTFEFLNPKRCRLTDRTGKEATAPEVYLAFQSHRNVLCTSSKIIGKVLQSDSFHHTRGIKRQREYDSSVNSRRSQVRQGTFLPRGFQLLVSRPKCDTTLRSGGRNACSAALVALAALGKSREKSQTSGGIHPLKWASGSYDWVRQGCLSRGDKVPAFMIFVLNWRSEAHGIKSTLQLSTKGTIDTKP